MHVVFHQNVLINAILEESILKDMLVMQYITGEEDKKTYAGFNS